MKAYGNVITGTVGAQSLDLPTTPAARPSHWPAKRDRTAWTSPIARSLDEAATRRAEQAATQAAVAEAREKDERERRARHAKAAPVKRAPAQRTTSKPVKERANASHRAAVELRERVETDLRALWAEGLPIWAIAVRLNVSETLVKRMASEFDLPRRRKALDPEQITRLYAEHRSIERVAELLDTSSAAIRYQLGKAGVQLRALGDHGARIPDDVRQAAIDAYRAGVSPAKIRHQYAIGETTLLRWIQQAGVTRRTPGERGDRTARDDEEASPAAAITSRAQLLEALTLERFGPPPRRPRASPPRPAERPVWLDPLPDIARRRRELLEALDGRHHHAEESA